jgi:putative endopeptidase
MKSGIDLSNVDSAVRVQDDLFRYLNGKWLSTFEIPADRASDGIGYALYEQAQHQVRDIIEGSDASDEGAKISSLYESFMSVERIEELGASPIANDLKRALEIKDSRQFIQLLAHCDSKGLGGLIGASVYTDHMDSTQNILYLSQAGLSLPDEAYYREEQYSAIREAFLIHVAKMFELAGIRDGQGHARRVLDLEILIAQSHWDQVKDRDATLTYNKCTRAELETLSSGFDWKLYLEASQIPDRVFEKVIVRETDFFTGIGSLMKDFDLASWSSWLAWHIISDAAPYLNDEIVSQNFSFYGTTLSGTPQIRDRWKRGVSLVEGALGEAVGRIYVDRHFPPQAKKSMELLVSNLVEAYRQSIGELDWMSSETKVKALDKLSKFTPKIGYPDKWRDYSALLLDPADLMGNMERIAVFSRDFELAKIGSPVDRSEWYMTPQTVNAYYNPGMNEIVFPAAILQEPFFTFDADDAANYGGIGAIIGHEISHGFDDQGSKYDGDGNLSDWWSQKDREEFEKRAAVLIAQFDTLRPEEAPEITVNGALTVGENIGDLSGLAIAYRAYQLALRGSAAPLVDSLTGDERFFYSWAQAWRGKTRPEATKRQIATDPHSPNEFRCNQIVKNMDAFASAFNLHQGDGMFLPEGERLRIW